MLRIFTFVMLVLVSNVKAISQNASIGDIAYRNMKHISKVVDTSVIVKNCDHHGNSHLDTISVRLHFKVNNEIAAVEIIFSIKEKYSFYYFNNGKLIMIERSYEEGEIWVQEFPTGISFRCLYNWDGTFVKGVTEQFIK